MACRSPSTLAEALATLPPDPTRGFCFRGLDGKDRFYSWSELDREAKRRAAQLRTLGLRKGDRLALVIAEPREFVLTFLGAVVGGVVPVPIYPRASFKAKNAYVDTIAHIVRASGARVLLTMASTKPVVDEIVGRTPDLENIVILEEFLQCPEDPQPGETVSAEDICFLQFTSGSTSMPKGVVVTHRNLIANATAFLSDEGLGRHDDDVAVTWLPLYHDMGLIGFVLGTIIRDIKTVLLPTEAFARRPSMWMQAMHDYGGTITFAPNFAYALAAKRVRDRELKGLDLSRIRVAGCGAEPINPQVLRAFVERFGPVGFKENALLPAYGMAEATLAISFHPDNTPIVTDAVDPDAIKRGRAEPAKGEGATVEMISCGPPFEGHEVRILDEDHNPLPERRVGQIATRGPSVTPGYYEQPEATAQSYVDGWLHTGDLGYMVDGNIYVCGRIKDLIIIRGANFYPQDIEWAVAEVPGVRRDNVVAFSVMLDGTEALVIAAEGNSQDAPTLRRTIAIRVAETCGLQPAYVAVVRVGSLPKTSSGKIMRRKTKDLFEQGALEEHRTGAGEAGPQANHESAATAPASTTGTGAADVK